MVFKYYRFVLYPILIIFCFGQGSEALNNKENTYISNDNAYDYLAKKSGGGGKKSGTKKSGTKKSGTKKSGTKKSGTKKSGTKKTEVKENKIKNKKDKNIQTIKEEAKIRYELWKENRKLKKSNN